MRSMAGDGDKRRPGIELRRPEIAAAIGDHGMQYCAGRKRNRRNLEIIRSRETASKVQRHRRRARDSMK